MALGLETAKTPLLQDLYEELLKQPEPEARRLATALELYCTGSLNLFNHPTNVNLNSQVVCIVLKGPVSYTHLHWEEMQAENIGCLFWGNVGNGKSYLAGCIAHALMEKEVPVYMTNFAVIPVSYTHLDVSKRQDCNHPKP